MRKSYIFLMWAFALQAFADEGMWLPFLLKSMKQDDLKKAGLKLKIDEIYNEQNPSLKDAIVIFGGGCTGEVISHNGLVLTNHHCGLDGIQSISSVKSDYVTNGFFAKNKAEEIPIPGLKVSFVIKTIDVTDITLQTTKGMQGKLREQRIAKLRDSLNTVYTANTTYSTVFKSFFNDNNYYLFVIETYKDIRVVAYPPLQIGNFGGDYDNWVWPRHNADFGMFRIYANTENKPADYNPNNVPYKPKKSLAINTKGTKEGDFTMVFGFPGRTQQYLTSEGVAQIMNIVNPARIKIREQRLNIWKSAMDKDKQTFVQYIDKHNYISNYYKKWQGELVGLKINNAIETKQKQEADFNTWAQHNEYRSVVYDINQNYTSSAEAVKVSEYFNEALLGSELLKFAQSVDGLVSLDKTDPEYLNKLQEGINQFFSSQREFVKNYNKSLDKRVTEVLWNMYTQDISSKYHPNFIKDDIKKSIDDLFAISIFTDTVLVSMGNSNPVMVLNALQNDIAYQYYTVAKRMFAEQVEPSLLPLKKNNELYSTYIKALPLYQPNKKWYPDANSTMRLTYGKVQKMQPRDGIEYNYFTTLDGVMAKENKEIKEYSIPEKLKQLYRERNYGAYADANGKLRVAFISSNHTTGGNSGSPILNAKGELIGLNFDRIWEGTMSDIKYDINLCRNLGVDIRYILFIVDKYGSAKWILDELKIIR